MQFLWGYRLGRHGQWAAYVAMGAIVGSLALSFAAAAVWMRSVALPHMAQLADDENHGDHSHAVGLDWYLSGDCYQLVSFGDGSLSIGYYIDTLTILMFCVVSVVAACVHIYAVAYMHSELYQIEDTDVILKNG